MFSSKKPESQNAQDFGPYRMSKWRRAIFSPSFENSAMPHRDASAAHWRSRGAAASAPLPEDHPEAFLELVRGPEGLVGVRDVLEPGALGGVQVRLVLQQRPPGALDRVPDAFAGRAGPPGLAPCGAVLTLSSASAPGRRCGSRRGCVRSAGAGGTRTRRSIAPRCR